MHFQHIKSQHREGQAYPARQRAGYQPEPRCTKAVFEAAVAVVGLPFVPVAVGRQLAEHTKLAGHPAGARPERVAPGRRRCRVRQLGPALAEQVAPAHF